MKLNVSGIEVIELTDPQGLCNQPVPQVGSPAPPCGVGPVGGPYTPYTGDPPPKPTGMNLPWTNVVQFDPDYNEKWGRGLPQTQAPEPDKWEKNLQSKMSPEQQKEAFDHGYTAITQ